MFSPYIWEIANQKKRERELFYVSEEGKKSTNYNEAGTIKYFT